MGVLDDRQRIVVKIGSSLLVSEAGELREDWLDDLVDDISNIEADVLIVSSGAIALGRKRLGLTGKLTLAQKQAAASAGQSRLTQGYELAFQRYKRPCAQALLTLDDTENRRRWLNARQTLETLLGLGAVPIINENDTVATDEIRYGDNDRLAARTAQMVGADLLVLLSDIDGLYTADPRVSEDAQHIGVVEELTQDILAMGGKAGSSVGTGGMATKLLAAKIAVEAGCDMIVCDGCKEGALGALARGGKHTLFRAKTDPKRARAQWIAGSLSPTGTLTIDAGAAHALQEGKSLLAAGLTQVEGTFAKGDTVSIHAGGAEVARGLSAYDSHELGPICGLRSDAITHPQGSVVVHRDNMVML